ncbi:putative protein S-acyltransferase [Lupinus albus]|uniref:S-acyltransferase n=1 Tax=Lupinus albus TaxID=3870 RepID=A0A6A4PXV3_LUPAL|nr:putative protein S-acyltransferase [Lupinus albus]
MSCNAIISELEQEKLLEKLQVFKIKGKDKRGRKILRIIGKFFPARLVSVDVLNKYLEEKVFPKLGKRKFCVLYVHTGVNRSENFPGISALRSIYDAIPANVKENLEAVYFIHSGLQARLFLATFGRFLFSAGLYGKLRYISRVDYLWEHVKRKEVEIPEFVFDHDDDLEYRPMMDYGLESDHARVYARPPTFDSPISTYSMSNGSMFPIFSLPRRRSSLWLKLAFVTIHIVYIAILFLFDGDLVEKTKKEPWYTALYLLLCAVTLIQYFATSIASPGYALNAMRAVNERNAVYRKTSETSSQSASSRNGSFIVTVEGNQIGRSVSGSNATDWSKLVADLYSVSPIRTWTCTYCNVEQPPRTKHCHDCDKCVLQFDHHCVWLGNCIGQGNHCRFWWYLCEETALCLWTGFLYVSYLKAHITWVWWQDVIMILLLIFLAISLIFLLLLMLFHSYLILTNQTTYELVRRRRINYLRGIPERVHPFSKGVCRNVYNFCCLRSSVYNSLDPLPLPEEIEEKSRPYTCLDVVTGRCC